jgi:hypothetical protein
MPHDSLHDTPLAELLIPVFFSRTFHSLPILIEKTPGPLSQSELGGSGSIDPELGQFAHVLPWWGNPPNGKPLAIKDLQISKQPCSLSFELQLSCKRIRRFDP